LKIILINPYQVSRYSQPPVGLAVIAGVLEKNGYQVSIIDGNALKIEPKEISSYIIDASIVLLTAMTPTINITAKIAQQIKQVRPDIQIILGGVHATLLPEDTLSSIHEIDIIVRGEGEETILELLSALQRKAVLNNISGIAFRSGDKIINTNTRLRNINLDSLPFLPYHLLPVGKYRPHPPHGRALPFAAIVTSRGCPYNCAYCSKPVFGNKFRAQSSERVVEEVSYYKKRFGIKEVAFYDDVFTLDKKRAFAIAEGMIEKGLKLFWTCETRANLVDRELLLKMRQAGCYSVSYGIESSSQEILDAINKDITPEKVEEAIHLTREAGLQATGYFMVGCPGETPQTIRKSIDFAKHLKLDYAQFAITTPFPGTELYRRYLEGKGNKIPWENFIYEGTGGKVTPVFENEALSRKDLQYWSKKAYRDFYLRPSYIWQRIRQIKSFGDLRITFSGFTMLMRSITSH